MHLVRNWKVRIELESLSDHLYISFDINMDRPELPLNRSIPRKWNSKKFDKEFFFIAVLIWRALSPIPDDRNNMEKMTLWLDKIMEEACDIALVRIGPRRPKRHAYWWRDSTAAFRYHCIQARRSWHRAKRRKKSETILEALGKGYK